jgi:hypothetical protein
MPYRAPDGSEPRIILEVVGPTDFALLEGFVYVDGFDSNRAWDVPPDPRTDLASIPWFAQWLIRSYGKHTRAALVHDAHWKTQTTRVGRREVNAVFLHAMREGDVAFVRRWLIWSAVALAAYAQKAVTEWWHLVAWLAATLVVLDAVVSLTPWAPGGAAAAFAGALVAVALVAFLVAWIVGKAGTDAATFTAVTNQIGVIAAAYALIAGTLALAGPLEERVPGTTARLAVVVLALVATAVVLGADWRAGIVGSVGAILVLVPMTGVFLGVALYGAFEVVVFVVRFLKAAATDQRRPTPPATSSLGS